MLWSLLSNGEHAFHIGQEKLVYFPTRFPTSFLQFNSCFADSWYPKMWMLSPSSCLVKIEEWSSGQNQSTGIKVYQERPVPEKVHEELGPQEQARVRRFLPVPVGRSRVSKPMCGGPQASGQQVPSRHPRAPGRRGWERGRAHLVASGGVLLTPNWSLQRILP